MTDEQKASFKENVLIHRGNIRLLNCTGVSKKGKDFDFDKLVVEQRNWNSSISANVLSEVQLTLEDQDNMVEVLKVARDRKSRGK